MNLEGKTKAQGSASSDVMSQASLPLAGLSCQQNSDWGALLASRAHLVGEISQSISVLAFTMTVSLIERLQ